MGENSIAYTCPNAGTCSRHKHCHVLTTTEEIPIAIPVKQQCPAEGKMPDGRLKEIIIYIGKVT